MDILITLPKNLIEAIREGRKRIDVRKSTPLSFDRKKDWVYVVEKGTKKVTLSFKVSKFEEVYNTPYTSRQTYERYKDAIMVSWEWFEKYIKGAKDYRLWHIDTVLNVDATLDSKIANPESYKYLTDEYLHYND